MQHCSKPQPVQYPVIALWSVHYNNAIAAVCRRCGAFELPMQSGTLKVVIYTVPANFEYVLICFVCIGRQAVLELLTLFSCSGADQTIMFLGNNKLVCSYFKSEFLIYI